MKLKSLFLVWIASACLLTGCDNAKKMSADAAIKTADTTLTPILADAQKYVPDQTKAVTDTLQQAKTSFANGDYSAALDSAKGLPAQVNALSEAVKAKKAELTAKFNELNASMPGLVSAVQTRFDALRKTHKLPAGADGAFSSLKQTWGDASTSMQSGDLSAAMDKATAAKDKLMDVQKMLGMKPAAS